MPNTLIYSHHAFEDHEVPPGHVEHSGRYRAVEEILSSDVFADAQHLTAPIADLEITKLAHPDHYTDYVKGQSPVSGLTQLDADTFMGPTSLEATLRATGAVCAGVDAVFEGKVKNAFVAARPPGHHAEPERAMGFCVFNHVAIAARYARENHGAEKIAVVDFDVHHGNGTEAIFWHDENAFFASSHEWPQYPGTGRETDRGAVDNIHNAPLATGTDGEGFRRAWGERLLPALADFSPEIIIISAGFDAHQADPLGGLELVEDDFAWVTQEIMAIARDSCQDRIVSVLEGGYDIEALASSAAYHVKALMRD